MSWSTARWPIRKGSGVWVCCAAPTKPVVLHCKSGVRSAEALALAEADPSVEAGVNTVEVAEIMGGVTG